MLRLLDLEALTDRWRDRPEIFGIGSDHEIATPQSAFGDADIHDVVEPGSGGEGVDRASLHIVKKLDLASVEETSELGLAPSATPGLRDDRRCRRRNLANPKQSAV